VSISAVSVQPLEALPVFARLYGLSEQDTLAMTAQMTFAWVAQNQDSEILGAIGLRPSPAHGSEVMGGAFAGSEQQQAATTLIQAALAVQPRLYAYAEVQFLPAEALNVAGLDPVSAYTRMVGPLPIVLPEVSNGFSVARWSEANLEDRLAAQSSYSDRIGHTHVTAEAVALGLNDTDDALSRIAYDASGKPAGVCRASLNGEALSLGTPGVRPDLRGIGLRQALLLSVCQAARALGATQLILEGWGDRDSEQLEDKALGLVLEEQIYIYASTSI
jgi:GNAT superfamily N-acetyltransferase